MLKLKKIKSGKKVIGLDMPMMDSYPPTVHLNDTQVPEIKDWDVGETYQIVMDVKQTSKSEDKNGNVNSSFEVVGYKPVEDDMSDSDLEDLQGKAMSTN